jgi:hypothetical protein
MMCVLLCGTVGACVLDDVDDPAAQIADEPDAGGLDDVDDPAEKHFADAVQACRNTCVAKYVARCPVMDSVDEYLACRDGCIVQTWPDACEAEYIALQDCRALPPRDAYTCNAAGQPASARSCLLAQLSLAYCRQQHP